MRATAYIWNSVGGTLGLALGLGLAVWLFFGPLVASVCFALVILAAFIYHAYHLHRLVRWTREPVEAPMPQAHGVWDDVFADLHRRARANLAQRERLSQALTRFRAATAAMPDGVVLLSAENFIEWINPAAALHFELDPRHDVGKPMLNLVRQPDFVSYLQSSGVEPVVCKLSRHAGRVLSIQIVPFGEEQRMVLSRDITQFERMETIRRDFVANVSHELKTPLTVIGGFLETIDDTLEDLPPAETHRYLQLASEQATRMRRLVEDLLELSKLETSAAASMDETIEMAPLLAQLIEEGNAYSAGRHTLTLHSDGPAALRGSRKELHSAFLNLITNAVRYTAEGGHIRVMWNVAPGGGARFTVEDNGIGIAAEHLPRLTERFYRVDRGRSRDSGGTGLGLAIVKHTLSHHQATLEIESQLGRGSCFSTLFPSERVYRPAAP
ncbi:MAG: phosphate regulon sensor histidine kinase PhoR [Betaproteobacteria bacterium]|nr:phosphate regulon sensor histidine kinase PhoR [Betaproteobacteria bacterium]